MTKRKSVETDNSPIRIVFFLVAVAVLVGGYFFITSWLRPPAVSLDNLKYIQLLRTAVSSQKVDYVNKVNEAIEGRKSEGKMSDSEWNHFQSIILTAKLGDWEAADRACIKFETAQLDRNRPTE